MRGCGYVSSNTQSLLQASPMTVILQELGQEQWSTGEEESVPHLQRRNLDL